MGIGGRTTQVNKLFVELEKETEPLYLGEEPDIPSA